ncbi:uncharacterized protein SAPINGB_P004232 [Magnusiomyces paraingens]|uniref:Uncharacterized protein n=1 Tax=Magnusiomyces paraingens TaxID=2606893 RepID=A0A5E8BTC9_9ASCO|nr:uncharacterized protein SAPINGB_P004232 [Saprochaete ingens]VVT54746.1 unnamed protein product [Saprochaete ingens]
MTSPGFVLSKIPIVLAALVAIYWLKFKPEIDLTGLTHLPLKNNEKCRVLHDIRATEDIAIDNSAGIAYVGSASETTRFTNFPGLGRHNHTLPRPFDGLDPYREDLFVFDLETEKFSKLNIVNYADDQDLIVHGTALRSFAPGVNTLYIVNHKRTGSVISIFKHKVGSPNIEHVRDVKTRHIYIPNSVTVIDETHILVTNDHGFYNGPLRRAEDLTGFKHLSTVALCEIRDFSQTNSKGLKCKIVARGLSYANGIEYIEKSNRVAVCETLSGMVQFYKYDGTKKTLTYEKEVRSGGALDNVKLIPGTNDLVLATFADPGSTLGYIHHGLDFKGPVAMLATVLKEKDNYEKPIVGFHDSAEKLGGFGFMTGVVFVPKAGKMLGGSCSKEGLLVCDIDYANV